MEDWEAQDVEFWRKLDEEGISRSAMLRRSAAAAFGLTLLASPAAALASRGRLGASPPLKGKGFNMAELVALYRQGRLKLDELISGRYPLERINEAVAAADRGEALRAVIVF